MFVEVAEQVRVTAVAGLNDSEADAAHGHRLIGRPAQFGVAQEAKVLPDGALSVGLWY